MTARTNPARSPGIFGTIANLPLAVKLIISFVVVVAAAVGVLAYFSSTTTSAQLIEDQGNNLHDSGQALASSVVTLINNEVLGGMRTLALNKIIQDAAVQANASYTGSPAEILDQLAALDRNWAALADGDIVIQARLTNDAASDLIEFQNTFTDHVEMLVTDRYGALIAATNRTSDYYQADEVWWQKAWNNGLGATYVGQPEYDESSDTFSIIASLPLSAHNESGTDGEQISGVLRTTFKFERLGVAIAGFAESATGQAELLFPDGTFLDEDEPDQIQPLSAEDLAVTQAFGDQIFVRTSFEGDDRLLSVVPISAVTEDTHITNLNWSVAVSQNTSDALAVAEAATQNILGVGAVVTIISALFAVLLARLLSFPISRLNRTTQQFAAGDFSQRATAISSDEIGQLAKSFNVLAEQIQGQFGTLEERVAERTRDLQAVFEVSARVATILEPERLLRDVADLTKERFRLYHSHIYLVDETGEILKLTAGAGYVGRQMVSEKRQIAMENPQSIVAGAARSRKGIIVNDVRESPTFLPHPLLPDTRSELAVPLVARGQLLGVLDVQSDQVGYFNDTNMAVIDLMANQIAAAISNARLYEAADRSSRHERALGTIERKIQSALSIDEVLQTGVRELGKALRVPYTAIELQLTPTQNGSAEEETQQ